MSSPTMAMPSATHNGMNARVSEISDPFKRSTIIIVNPRKRDRNSIRTICAKIEKWRNEYM